MDKRYQVFVSSTYVDLKEERRAIIQTLIEMDCIPAGMELFPAADEEQFEFIKKIIDDCDYYILIIGGRYGSTTSDGLSYTEKEYDYARGRGLKVLSFIHENPGAIPMDKSELDPVLRGRLGAFRAKAKIGTMVRPWADAKELPGLVAVSLQKTIKTYPAVGWVRADQLASAQVLSELNEVRKRNEELENRQKVVQPILENLAALDDKFIVHGTFWAAQSTRNWQFSETWGALFASVAPDLLSPATDSFVEDRFNTVSKAIYVKSLGGNPYFEDFFLDDQCFRAFLLKVYSKGGDSSRTCYGATIFG
jgi:hypothetical protein